MKHLFALIKLFLIFQIVLNSHLLSSAKKKNLSQASSMINILGNEMSLTALNSNYYAKVQNDGNFVIYSTKQTNGIGRDNAIWASNTQNKGKAPYQLKMQEDGNLVLSDSDKNGVWASNVYNVGWGPYAAVMQDDGNLVVYDVNGKVVWASGTNGKKF